MVRDWNLIRNLLVKIEDETLLDFLDQLSTDVKCGTGDPKFESDVARHLSLLIDAKFVTGIQIGSTTPKCVHYVRIEPNLTMEGYDLLEILRSKETWGKVTDFFKKTGHAVTLESIKAVTLAALKSLLT